MKRGWCPGLYRPMPTGDGLLVRLRPPGGQISFSQLAMLADASECYATGIVELTGQARLQIRGLSDQTLPAFTAAMVEARLAVADPEGERRRRVIVLPGGDRDLGREIDLALTAAKVALAEKFDVMLGIDGEAPVDITLHQGLLWPAGARQAARVVDPVTAVLQLARHLDGARAIEFDPDELFDAAGLTADAEIPTDTTPAIGAFGGGFGIATPFGTMFPETLRLLAGLGERHCAGTWHLTRCRALWLDHVRDAAAFAGEAKAYGLITRPDDPRRRVSACIGQPGCASATANTRLDALALLSGLPNGLTLHLSGCEKRCGEPRSDWINLVHVNGAYQERQGKHFFFEKKKQKTFSPEGVAG